MNVFISYRREDAAPYAGRIYDRLCGHFGRRRVFMDIDTIRPGDDFVGVIEETIALCDIVVVLIGRRWLGCTDVAGQRRIDGTEDLVRLEIASALKRGTRVIPVLVDGAVMPSAVDLPESLSALPRRHALDVSDSSFGRDADRLIEAIKSVGNKRRTKVAFRRRSMWAVVAGLVVLAAGTAVGLWHFLPVISRSSGVTAPGATAGAGLWAGQWSYVCDTRLGPIRGQMLLTTEGAIGVTGSYHDRTVHGTVTGTIDNSSDMLIGTWKNERGQEGRFQFKLRPDRRTFDGSYSMSMASEPPEGANAWNGVRE